MVNHHSPVPISLNWNGSRRILANQFERILYNLLKLASDENLNLLFEDIYYQLATAKIETCSLYFLSSFSRFLSWRNMVD